MTIRAATALSDTNDMHAKEDISLSKASGNITKTDAMSMVNPRGMVQDKSNSRAAGAVSPITTVQAIIEL